ncbi:MAG: hypothetical protein JRF47_16855, partial [Deltaproteobacteria bacterium]|nr:hypothetical protein [Deltaproteobacteria bacterium]
MLFQNNLRIPYIILMAAMLILLFGCGGEPEVTFVDFSKKVAVAFSIVMLGPWGFIKDAANVTESKQVIPFFIYLAAIWSSALLIVPGLFMLVAKGAHRLAGAKINSRLLTLRLAYILIPVGICAWIAFSLPAIMVNYGYIISVFSDPLGLGWDLLGTADTHFKALIPDWIPVIQGLILLAGLYLG